MLMFEWDHKATTQPRRAFLRFKDKKAPGGYVDCYLAHADLKVKILDEDAVVYLGDNYNVLDYSVETITGGLPPEDHT